MKLNTKTRRAIVAALNKAGYRGYRKDLIQRINLDTGQESFNCLITEADGNSDLRDIAPLDHWRALELDPVNGEVQLDIALYYRDELVDYKDVYVYDLGNGHVMATTERQHQGQILTAAVAAQGGQS